MVDGSNRDASCLHRAPGTQAIHKFVDRDICYSTLVHSATFCSFTSIRSYAAKFGSIGVWPRRLLFTTSLVASMLDGLEQEEMQQA